MSFTSGTFLAPRALYIKCTTCFSWRATRFCVICITGIGGHPCVYGKSVGNDEETIWNEESSPRVWEIYVACEIICNQPGVIPACMGNLLIDKDKYTANP